MAEPQKNPQAHSSVVGECSATDCRHNEERECHAGEIMVKIAGSSAVCGTYDPEGPRARP
jgi:hypothetical protein